MSWYLKITVTYLFICLLGLTRGKSSNLRIIGSFVNGGFPSQRASNLESSVMAWRHHVMFACVCASPWHLGWSRETARRCPRSELYCLPARQHVLNFDFSANNLSPLYCLMMGTHKGRLCWQLLRVKGEHLWLYFPWRKTFELVLDGVNTSFRHFLAIIRIVHKELDDCSTKGRHLA